MRSIYLFAQLLAQVQLAFCLLPTVLDSDTEAFITKVLEDWKSPTGISVAVVRYDNSSQGWFTELNGYGSATLDGSKNVTVTTRFGIGSNTKLFTATAAGLLMHDSRVSKPFTWTSKMKDLLPGWGLEDELASNAATVQDLLSHRTGLPRHDAAVRRTDTNVDVLRKVRNQKPSALFRDIWQYNNNMYKIIAMLAPTLLPSHQSHARYVKENIFDKLGLNDTTFSYAVANSTGELADGIARQVSQGNVIPHAIPYWLPDSGEDGNIDAGDGAIVSTALDLSIWLQTFLLNGVNLRTKEPVIPADVIQRLITGYSVELGGNTRFPELGPIVYGAGQERGSYRGQEFIEHSGACPGYNTVISRYPGPNYGIAVLSNDGDLGGIIVQIIRYYLADRILGLDAIDWNARFQALYSAPSGPPPTPRPANATFPYGDIKKLEGVYDNAGYGKTELCYIPATNSSSSSVTGGSKACDALRVSAPIALSGFIQPDAPTFVAVWNETSLSHIMLRHFDGGLFNLSAFQSYPTGDPSNPYWAQDLGVTALAEVNKGLTGLGFTGVWGSNPGVPEPSGSTLQERSEVWFQRT